MNLEKAIKELNKIIDITKRIEKLIEHLEVYLMHNSMGEAQEQEGMLVKNIKLILSHLNRIQKAVGRNPHLKNLVKKEEQVFFEIEKYLVDIVQNPSHMKKDAHAIQKLEIFLEDIELKELDQEK